MLILGRARWPKLQKIYSFRLFSAIAGFEFLHSLGEFRVRAHRAPADKEACEQLVFIEGLGQIRVRSRAQAFGAGSSPAPGLGSAGNESGEGSVNVSSVPFQGGQCSVGVFVVFMTCLGLELESELAGIVGAEYSQGIEQRMRGVGQVAGAPARDPAADVIE